MAGLRTTTTSFSFLLLLSNIPQLIAQAVSILPSTPSPTYPACAFNCDNLNGASAYCIQTNVGASQQTVDSCFCQRAEVTSFYIASTGVCDAFCTSDSDRSTLQSWFQNYCATAGFSAGQAATVTTLVTSTRTPAATATGNSRTGAGTQPASTSQDGGWFASHWKWIVMVIVLFLGLSGVAVLAVCLKRRHARKVDKRRAALSGFSTARGGGSPETGHGRDMWGPHQHMAHTGGWDYTTDQDREMREASAAGGGGGVLGSAMGDSKNPKGGSQRRLGKKSRHGSQRSARNAGIDPDRVRGEEDENTRMATTAVRRSRSERRRVREEGQEREQEIERGLRGLPIRHHHTGAGKEKQNVSRDGGSTPEMSEQEKDIR
ncbi:hypothetical protein EPUS_04842 [Endocarpon pusillum Z07020]|uniref:Integral membrane protein n=1 Tax=Endocarpon pusillum (strain Z07020 / HMAS-L-300199) TaxID=1263415 RepID=U1HWC6_ENDPU|nr:uncharacterized protein EPUS_04842 [Endocarpon pusillum Z07020]ERF75060.1 hypothetical protein EPUS_04842 [Endocarpon pusillum Z07020]